MAFTSTGSQCRGYDITAPTDVEQKLCSILEAAFSEGHIVRTLTDWTSDCLGLKTSLLKVPLFVHSFQVPGT